MIQDILNAIPLGFFLAFAIGPVFFVLLETSITKGFRAALCFDCGVILGDVFFITITYFSARSFLEKLKNNPYLFILGGLILFLYGLFSYISERKKGFNQNKIMQIDNQPIKKNYITLFIKGFLLNVINIGVLGFWLGIIIVAIPRLEFDTNRIVVFFLTILIVYLLIDIIKVIIAKELRHKLTTKKIYQIKQITNIIIIIFGLILIFQALFPQWKTYLKQIF